MTGKGRPLVSSPVMICGTVSQGFTGDGGPATSATLTAAQAVAVAP